jgi:hypothetical protein
MCGNTWLWTPPSSSLFNTDDISDTQFLCRPWLEMNATMQEPDCVSLRAIYFINNFEGHCGGIVQINMGIECLITFFFIYPDIPFCDSCDHLTISLWCASTVWGPVNQHLMHYSHCTTIMIRKWTEGMNFIVHCLLKDAISNNLMSSLLAP